MAIEKVVVIGGGTMGLDIAQAFAKAGFVVVVRDINDEIVAAAEERLKKSAEKFHAKGKMTDEQYELIQKNISFTTDLGLAADADLIVEAAVERLDIKRAVFKELDEICKPETIFATNTSSISITSIASATERQDRFIGMHFFNPATIMKLVEVILGAKTSDETFETAMEVCRTIGKEPVRVNEAPGFVVNKILVPMINEAADLVYTGVATPEDVDTAMKLGANHPIGPLALGDLIGLDVIEYVMDVLYNETHDSKYRCSLLLRKMVRSGKLGRKTGEGFYKY